MPPLLKLKKIYLTLARTSRIIITLALIDQATKWFFINKLRWTPNLTLKITSFLDMVYSWNYGISFGILRDHYQYSNNFFIVINSLIACYLYYLMIRSITLSGFVGYSFILGGAIGNIADRIIRGAVFDFIHFHYQEYSFPIFNLADCFITVGVLILIEDYYYTKKKIEEKSKADYDDAQIKALAEKIRKSDNNYNI